METYDFNILSFIIAIVAVVGTFFGILISALFSWKSDLTALSSNEIAKQANEIANKALDIAMFTHKGEIQPNLKGAFQVFGPITSITLTNISRGQAIIIRLTPLSSDFRFVEAKEVGLGKYPITLGLNNSTVVYVKFLDGTGEDTDLDLKYEYSAQISPSLARKFLLEKMKLLSFAIHYQDTYGTEYISILRFNDDSNVYEGTPREILESDPDHSKNANLAKNS